MRLRMKVHEGANRGICRSCKHAHIMSDERGRQEVYCNAMTGEPIEIRRVIVECNQYQKFNDMTEWEAKQQGWVLEVKGARVIGFRKPGEDED